MPWYTLQKDGKNVANRLTHRPETLWKYKELGFTILPGKLNLSDVGAGPETKLNDIRAQRNRLLDEWAWTVGPASPLSVDNQAAWLTYLQALHGITAGELDVDNPAWPERPELEYA